MRLPGSLADVEHSPQGPRIGAFFDLDGTLVAGYTAGAVSRERMRKGEVSGRDLIRSIGPLIAFARGRMEFSEMLQFSSASMAGMAAADEQEMGRAVFRSRVEDLIYPEMRRLVQAHRDRGHTVVLSSSALALQAEPVAEFLGIEHVLCNRFEEADDETLTGRVVEPVIWGPGKSDAVQNFCQDHGIELSQSYFYADGDEDAGLMYLVGKPRPTNPGPMLAAAAKRRGWPVLEFSSRGAGGPKALARQAFALGSLVSMGGYGLAVGLVTRNKRKGLNVLMGAYPQVVLQSNGVSMRVQGRENLEAQRPAIFLFNHRTAFDGLMAAALVGHDYTVVAKKELEKDPFMGGVVGKLMDTAYVERGNTAASLDSLRRIQELAAKGLSILMAPEGTRADTTSVAPFKKGAFRMAMAAKIPLVPIVFRNAEEVSGRRATTLNPGQVDVLVAPPISVANWRAASLDKRIAEVRQFYLDTLADWPTEASS